MGLFSFKKKAKPEQELEVPQPPHEDVSTDNPVEDIPKPPSDVDLDIPEQTSKSSQFPEPPSIGTDESFDMPSFPEPPSEEDQNLNLPPMDEEISEENKEQFKQPATELSPEEKPEEESEPSSNLPLNQDEKHVPESPSRNAMPKKTKQPENLAFYHAPENIPRDDSKPDFSKPLFISFEEYKEFERNFDDIRSDMKKVDDNLEKLIVTNSETNQDFEKLSRNADFMLRKLNYLDKKLFKKG